jgi:DNA-binding NtrC family response regulator
LSRVNYDSLKAALDQTQGNITRAASVLQISKVHAMRMVKVYGFGDYARELRVSKGGCSTGRPRS